MDEGCRNERKIKGRDEGQAAALADEKVAAMVGDGSPRKVIVVPGRLVNIVL